VTSRPGGDDDIGLAAARTPGPVRGWACRGGAARRRDGDRTSGGLVLSGVSFPFLPTLVLDHRSDVPHAYLKREGVSLVHAA
jgi:hypothetical protein